MSFVRIANLRGPAGPMGPGGPGSVPADTAVAGYVGSGSSLTDAELKKKYAVMGPKPSGGDDTAAFLAAMLQAQSTTGILRLHAGTYNLTNLATAQSFQQPLIYGAGVDRTILNFTAGGVGIRFKGGAAGFSGGGIQDLTMQGAGVTAIEIQSACAMRHRRIRFTNLACGVLFHNSAAGEFSEQNVMEDCLFEASCVLWAEYRVTGGNDSFHGTGFMNCQFNVAPGGTSPKIKIGANVLIYNAPFDGWIWAPANVSLVDMSTATKAVYTYGHLRIETGNGSTTAYWMTSTTLPWSHAGTVEVLGETFRFNRKNTSAPFALVDRVTRMANTVTVRQRRTVGTEWDLGTGGTPTFTFDPGETALVSVHLVGANYDFAYVLAVYQNAGDGNGVITSLANGRAFNASGWGAPAFSIANNRLVITNAAYPATGVTATVTVTMLEPRAGLL